MLKRAYSLLDLKSVDEERRVITGVATSASTDRYGDVVEPGGAEFALPLPLLWQHNAREPVGEVFAAKTTPDGIEISARIAKTDTPGALKDRLDLAWQSITMKLVRGLSIGFRSIEEAWDKEKGGYHFLRWEWLELSAVTIPANQDATIQTIRSLDLGNPAGVSAPSRTTPVRLMTERPMTKKTFADQIAGWEATRASKVARQETIQQKATDDNRGKDDAEREEFETLGGEIASIDKELVDLRALETRAKIDATEVQVTQRGLVARPGTVITVDKKLPPGIAFARYAMCMGMARGQAFEAKEIAKQQYGDEAGIIVKFIDVVQKAAVGAAATTVAGWAQELVPYNLMDDFIEFLRPGTIIGKFGTNGIPPLRRVPFNVRVSGFSSGLTGNWVGEGLPVLLSKATSFATTLTWSKIAALAVLTKEEIRFSNPSAEAKVRDDIAKAIVQKQDKDFIDPAKAAVANVSPASVTNGTVPINATGTTSAQLRTDLASLVATFATANMDPSDIVLIMSTVDALNISLMITSLGNPVFPGITMNGGNLMGFPVITTTAMVGVGSPVSNIIVAVKASEIYLADDGVVTIDASDQASVEMIDSGSAQSGITGTGASLVSFWQSGLLGLKATREINWKTRRVGAARYIYNSAYKA